METLMLILKDFIVPLLAILTFIKAIVEYVKVLKWKKSEFLSKEIKEFYSDKDINLICKLLDWNVRKVELNGETVKIDDNFLESALLTHRKKAKFSEHEAIIRDKFDYFFDRLSYFNIYIENNLVSEKETLRYLSYYLDILVNTGRKDKKLVDEFNEYIDYYEFENVKSLLYKYTKQKKSDQ